MASPGRDPEIRNTKASGVLGWSFKRFWVVVFTYDARESFSVLDSIRAATPENSTGEQKVFSARREERGLARWRRDIPEWRILPRLFLWDVILCCM